jgi:hypothetical protein
LLRAGVAVFGLVATLCLLEVGIRVFASFDRNSFDRLESAPRTVEGRELTLADLIRPSSDERIVYELRPNVRGMFMGRELAISSLGYRDEERELRKKPGVFRIIGLGDSHMFGFGVRREETFVSQLEQRLRERFPGRDIEVWNLGVPGYNTVQEVETFASKSEALQPDLVIINYVNNDMDLPNFLAAPPDLWTIRKSYLAELAERRLALLRGKNVLPMGLFGLDPDEETKRYLFDPTRIPERYRALAGWDHMESAFDRLADLARARSIPVLLLFNMDDYTHRLAGKTPDVRPRSVRELAAHCASKGYVVVDPQDRVTQYLEAHGLDSSAIWLSPSDSHTNPLRHRLVAEELADAITRSRLIPPQ